MGSFIGADSLQDFMAVKLRKLQIEQDQLRKLAADLASLRAKQVVERLGTIARPDHLAHDVGLLERPQGQGLIRGTVFYQKNGLILVHATLSISTRQTAGVASSCRHVPGPLRRGRFVRSWEHSPIRSALERKVECCSVADLSLCPDPATMPADDSLHRDEPDAGTLEVGRGVKALKNTEQLRRVGHVEACTVVPHEIRSWVI